MLTDAPSSRVTPSTTKSISVGAAFAAAVVTADAFENVTDVAPVPFVTFSAATASVT